MTCHVMRSVTMVRVALLLCLLSINAESARTKAKIAHQTLLKSILLDEAGLEPPPKLERDRPSTSESSAMLNTTSIKCEGNKHWETGIRWTTGPSPRMGACGNIIPVNADNTNKSRQYAIKMPHWNNNQSSSQEIDHEAMIMQATTALFWTGHKPECQHVAPLLDPTPCLDDVLILTGAYATLKMEMDLQKWYDQYAQYNDHVRKKCQRTVARQLADGLLCLHTAGKYGFMHGDFKMDNVLMESIDPETGCPRGLRLIDFGFSHALGSVVTKHSQTFFEGSVHLPGSVFEGAPDTLSLTLESKPDKFHASSLVDWCSYAYLMNTFFHYHSLQEASKFVSITLCGKMGDGRKLVGRKGRDVHDVQGGVDVQGIA